MVYQRLKVVVVVRVSVAHFNARDDVRLCTAHQVQFETLAAIFHLPQPSQERMKTMATHGSATVREETPHVNQPTRTKTILNALTRRAQAILNDKSIDAESRTIIRYALEVNDPWLADLVRRVESGERIGDTLDFSQADEQPHEASGIDSTLHEHASSRKEINGLADMICRR